MKIILMYIFFVFIVIPALLYYLFKDLIAYQEEVKDDPMYNTDLNGKRLRIAFIIVMEVGCVFLLIRELIL